VRQLVHALLHRDDGRPITLRPRNIDMLTVKYHSLEPIADPTPRTTSDEDISKAQAIREALRRELLNRAEPESIPCWIVGAD
jgi:hypothetical protein